MKIQKLKEIIREEVKKALRKENSTKTAPVKPGTAQPSKPEEEKQRTTNPKYIPDKDRKNLPSTNPKSEEQQQEGITAKDFVNKYNKLKRK